MPNRSSGNSYLSEIANSRGDRKKELNRRESPSSRVKRLFSRISSQVCHNEQGRATHRKGRYPKPLCNDSAVDARGGKGKEPLLDSWETQLSISEAVADGEAAMRSDRGLLTSRAERGKKTHSR